MLTKNDLQLIREEVTAPLEKKIDQLGIEVEMKVNQIGLDLDKKITQLGLEIASTIDDVVLPHVDKRFDEVNENIAALSSNTARKSELKVMGDDLRCEFRLQHAKRA